MSDEILGMDYLEAVEQSNITVFDKRNSLPADQLDADDLLGLYGELLDDYKGAMRRLRSIESEITRIRAELEAARAKPQGDALLTEAQVREVLGPYLREDTSLNDGREWEARISGWSDAIHTCARAFLARGPDEPSGLEGADA